MEARISHSINIYILISCVIKYSCTSNLNPNSFFYYIIIKTFVRFLMAHTTHWKTHVHGGDTGYTHTHAGRPEVAR